MKELTTEELLKMQYELEKKINKINKEQREIMKELKRRVLGE